MRYGTRGSYGWLFVLAVALAPSLAAAQPLNVRTFGATGNGSTDDTAAFNSALAAITSAGAEIYIPAGTYKLTSALTITNKKVAFRGEGQRVSILRWDSLSDGIVFSSTTTSNVTLGVASLSLLRGGGSTAGVAINATWASLPGWHAEWGLVTATIKDVNIAQHPYDAAGVGWDYGMRLTNATAVRVSEFAINGPGLGAGTAGISLEGHSIGTAIGRGGINKTLKGITVLDQSEGLHVTDVAIDQVTEGISQQNGPGTSIQSCEIRSTYKGIYSVNAGDVAITNNRLHKIGVGNWAGVHAIHGKAIRIKGNHMLELEEGGPSNGIILEGNSIRNVVEGNTSQGMDTGVWLVSPSVADNIVTGNLNRSFSVASVLNNGTGNNVVNNP